MALSNAVYVDLSFNKLNGPLPEEFGTNFTSLRQLYLDHNEFSGSIPESYIMAGDGSLVTLFLNDNMLTGGIPANWVDDKDKNAVPFINTIYAQNNNMTQGIDNVLCKLSISNDGGSIVQLEADCNVCFCNDFCSDCWGNNN